MTKNVSVLIAFDSTDPARIRAFEFVKARLAAQLPEAQICIGHDDSGAQYYCKSRALNNAAKEAAGEVFVVVDADVILDTSTLLEAIRLLDEHPWVIPFELCERLSNGATQQIMANAPDADIPGSRGQSGPGSKGPGGINVLPRAAWEAAGGYDEAFIGWGNEDVAFRVAVDTLYGVHVRMPDRVYHLWHLRGSPSRRNPHLTANQSRAREYRRRLGKPKELRAFMDIESRPSVATVDDGNKVDFLVANGRQYIDHLLPIWNALPEDVRGRFLVIEKIAEYARSKGLPIEAFANIRQIQNELRKSSGLVVVCGHPDPKYTDPIRRRSVVCYHGVGFNFDDGKKLQSYPGTRLNRMYTVLILPTNERLAKVEREANPHITSIAVGCPKLDKWHVRPPKPVSDPPVVAISFHWACKICPEAGTAWPHYKNILPEVAKRFKLLGHGHPNIMDALQPEYDRMGIEVVRDLEDVFERADVFVADATSAQYEFASLNRPVVVLNAPWYRRDVNWGLRFWEHSDVGVNCDEPEDLIAAIKEALVDSPEQQAKRKAAVDYSYAYTDGKCAQRAADAIVAAMTSPMPEQVYSDNYVTFRCDRYPELGIANQRIKFRRGIFKTRQTSQINALRRTALPIYEVTE